jgi:hypothetical protein
VSFADLNFLEAIGLTLGLAGWSGLLLVLGHFIRPTLLHAAFLFGGYVAPFVLLMTGDYVSAGLVFVAGMGLAVMEEFARIISLFWQA